MQARILFLTIVPPLPKNQGNRINTYSIIKYLVKQGFIIDLVMLGDCLKEQIEKEFQYKVSVYTTNSNYNKIISECNKRKIIKNALVSFLNEHKEYKTQIREMFYTANSFHPFELVISDDMLRKAEELLNTYEYDMIFCSYIFTMKIVDKLKYLIKVPVVLVTHDAHSKLNELAFKYNIDTSYRACTPAIEAEILNMADKILAITTQDKEYFLNIGVTKNIIVSEFSCFDVYREYKIKNSNFINRCIFYGAGDNPSNRMGLDYFLSRVWPTLLCLVPGINMVICGAISHIVDKDYKNIKVMGEISHEKMLEVMSCSTIGINPIFWGTGLKIKSVEYMSMGLPFVSFDEGVSGLKQFNREAFIIAEDWIDFGKKIVELLNDKEKWIDMSRRAKEIAESRFIDNVVFKDVL
ncbi:glycosyltransferase family 4 protein [Campylobacter lari]|nr:glycosyltransferase family 4 protein [Campylobacter lari]EAK9869206.1 glycosyltransferase family 4 protein [Campylobacter lari]EAK9882095.1 glycosyltransferase family 4 protein [Campylobacter lari]EGK8092958.1 glycosyltransferase family 4 protein [Campylobacter lari]EJV0519499.1 glycosyltransferase family 4 protein [Campylobacter lari]